MIFRRYYMLIPTYCRNRYFLTFIAFLVWMTFFDRNNFISKHGYKKELKQLEQEREFYQSEIAKNNVVLEGLRSDPEKLEKFAREKYFMKKDDEDIFVIVEEKKP